MSASQETAPSGGPLEPFGEWSLKTEGGVVFLQLTLEMMSALGFIQRI